MFMSTSWIFYYCYDAQEVWGKKITSPQINNKMSVRHLLQINPKEKKKKPKRMGSDLNAL